MVAKTNIDVNNCPLKYFPEMTMTHRPPDPLRDPYSTHIIHEVCKFPYYSRFHSTDVWNSFTPEHKIHVVDLVANHPGYKQVGRAASTFITDFTLLM